MSQNQIIEQLQKPYLKEGRTDFEIGDTVRVHLKLVEGNKERIQIYEGTVIARKGKSLSETFTVYRIAYGTSMKRTFMIHSPGITKIEVMRKGKVRRAKLYHLIGATGKKAKVKERLGAKAPKPKATSQTAE